MGRDQRAREKREQIIRIVHEPGAPGVNSKLKIDRSEGMSRKDVLVILARAVASYASTMEDPTEKAEAKGKDGKPLIARPNAAGLAKFGK